MRGEKIYSISILRMLINYTFSAFIIATGIVFAILFWKDSSEVYLLKIPGLALPLLIFAFGVYTFYACCTYYKHDKNVQIHIDYEEKTIIYIKDGEPVKKAKFVDILLIESHIDKNPIGYNRIFFKDDSSIIVTSFIADIAYAFPKCLVVSKYTRLLPTEKIKEKKSEFDDIFDDDTGWERFE